MTETNKFLTIVAATFLGGWIPCAFAGRPDVGLAAGLGALLLQQMAVWVLFDSEEDE